MIKKAILLLLCFNAFALLIVFFQGLGPSLPPESTPATPQVIAHEGPTTIQLQKQPFTVLAYPPSKSPPLAVILFGSGDGGWDGWETSVAHALQSNGYMVVGIDSAYYAKTDYDLPTLQADYNTIAQAARAPFRDSPPPVIVGGWSMGAAQAIAVAGGPKPPQGLIGVVAISALSRGRYGLRISDRVDILPTGPGTFDMNDFAAGMNGLRIVQWHAQTDTDDSTAWLSSLRTPHREIDYPSGHDFEDASPAFCQKLVESVNWILQSSP